MPSSHPRGTAAAIAAAGFVLLLLAVLPAVAHGKVTRKVSTTLRADGFVQVTPDRWEGDVTPGETERVQVIVLNRTDEPISVKLTTTDLAPSKDPNRLVEIVQEAKFGAGAWLEPEIEQFTLKSLEEIRFDVVVRPPADAPVGSNFAGLQVDASAVGEQRGNVAFKVQGLSQFFINIPGEVHRDTRLVSAEVADTFLFAGSGFVSYELTYENRGNVNDHAAGEIVVRSIFGNTVTTLDLKSLLVLRGSRRTIRVLWPNTPKFGRFSAQARVETDEKRLREQLPHVVILPPWWLLVLIASAVLLPLGWRWYQSRRSWRRYLDEDWDEEWDEDEDWDAQPSG